MSAKPPVLPLAERRRLLDWLYRERLFRPAPPAAAEPQPNSPKDAA